MTDDRTATLLDALISHHVALAGRDRISGTALYRRARLLHALGQSELALPDLDDALQDDPDNPDLLAWTCLLRSATGRPAHDLALRLLRSPFAEPDQRRMALGALDPAALPLVLHSLLPGQLRVTLALRAGDRVDCSGLGPRLRQHVLDRQGAITVMDLLDPDLPGPGHQIGISLNDRQTHIQPVPPARPAAPVPAVLAPRATLWIIVPVRDGGQVVIACLEALRRAMRDLPGCRLLLVDDGSETPLIRDRLAAEARRPRVRLLRTSGGLGYTEAVNLGLAAAGRGPVLLLNSDTWMPPRTLPRLLAHLRDPSVGIVTPLSNNAGSLSLPGPGVGTAMPGPAVCTALAAAAWRLHRGRAVDLPSANGFCMLLSAACRAQVGPLSAAYESGYYEEVDYSLRAEGFGLRSVAAIDCFVGHVGSVTYGPEKARLVAANRQRLIRNFPEYEGSYSRFLRLDPLGPACRALLAATAGIWQPRALPTAWETPVDTRVFVLPDQGGAPALLPLDRDRLAPPLRRHRFRRLRPVPRAQLLAHGLRLENAHGLHLAWDDTHLQLQLHDRQGRLRLSLACDGAGPEDLHAFETAVIDLMQDPSAHALSV